MQGNPGEGKTTFALRLAAACTTGRELPNMKPLPPFNVIYQTAEDEMCIRDSPDADKRHDAADAQTAKGVSGWCIIKSLSLIHICW